MSLYSNPGWVPFKPDAAVPASSVMEVTGTTTSLGVTIYTTQKYSAGDPRKVILTNSYQDVAADEIGYATLGLMQPVYVASTGSIAVGASCGPTDSSWVLTTDYPGFIAVEAAASNLVLVVRNPAPTICEGLAVGAVADTDGTYSVDNVKALSGLVPVANSSATLTVQNTFSDDIDDNGKVFFAWHESRNRWETLDVTCPA
jgi:hypothetical protein